MASPVAVATAIVAATITIGTSTASTDQRQRRSGPNEPRTPSRLTNSRISRAASAGANMPDRRQRATAVGDRGPTDHHRLQRRGPQRRPHRPRDHVRHRGEAGDLTPRNEGRARAGRRPTSGHGAHLGPGPEAAGRKRLHGRHALDIAGKSPRAMGRPIGGGGTRGSSAVLSRDVGFMPLRLAPAAAARNQAHPRRGIGLSPASAWGNRAMCGEVDHVAQPADLGMCDRAQDPQNDDPLGPRPDGGGVRVLRW